MIKIEGIGKMSQEEKLRYMLMLAKGQLDSEENDLANISNITGIIMACIDNLNWVGFYILREDELVLGPFQGLPACNRISMGKGVCGTAMETEKTQLVEDVEKFPGHIACDAASKSELVVPIIVEGKKYGVLDLDSPIKGRFTELEKKYFEELINILNKSIKWENI